MLSPLIGYNERDIAGVYVVAAAMQSGLAVCMDATVTTPLSPNAYGNTFGTVKVADTTNAGGSGLIRETGWLLQQVTTSGPSVFNLLSSIYDESVAAGAVAAVLLSKGGAQIATDQFLASGTGHIAFDGSVALDSKCAIKAGQPYVTQTSDVTRLLFKGQVTQRNTPCAIFEII